MKNNFLLSIVVPVFNEQETIKKILEKIRKTKYRKEIIVVNDGSSDSTGKILKNEKKITCQYGMAAHSFGLWQNNLDIKIDK